MRRAISQQGKGASSYDVCTQGERGGVHGKADKVRELSKGGCVKRQTEGEGEKSETFADVISGRP